MSVYQDTEFLYRIQNELKCFKKINNDLYNFRCPFCGDSTKNEYKARGYLYTYDGADGLIFKCHNCGCNASFKELLRVVNDMVYREYIFQKLKEKNRLNNTEKPKTDTSIFKASRKVLPTYEDSVLDKAIRLDKLPPSHACIAYCSERKIPIGMYPFLYYTDDFKGFVNSFLPGKFKTAIKEERLIIPYFDKHGRCYALQGRALDKNNPIRYFTIKIDENSNRIYGMDRVDFSKPIYVTEGPIDSMFLPNCLAVSGASYDDPTLELLKSTITVVPDNERRNKEVCQNIERLIDKGFKVSLWGNNIEAKDINEAIIKGYTQEELLERIKENTIQGFSGKLKFRMWKKC